MALTLKDFFHPGKVRRPRVDLRMQFAPNGKAAKTLIVLHQTISPDLPGIVDIENVSAYLKHVDYGIHVIVDRDGNSGAVDPDLETAIYWHCKGANDIGIGIEQVSYKTAVPGYWWPRFRQLCKTARWCAYLAKRHGIPLVYDPHGVKGICGHADVTRARGIAGGHTDCQYPNYPTKWVVRAAAWYARFGWR